MARSITIRRSLPLFRTESGDLNEHTFFGPGTFTVVPIPNPIKNGGPAWLKLSAEPWGTANESDGTIEGNWSSRWNGGADPTIPEDALYKWKRGSAQARIIGERVYLLFDWDRGARRGLIDAMRESPQRLVGKYINLSNPAITRPWVGMIVSDQRIDGRWPQGRPDFRR